MRESDEPTSRAARAKAVVDRLTGALGGGAGRRIARQIPMGVAAVLATYYTAQLLGLEDVTWALISALYVMQQTIDDAGRIALIRASATVIGSAVGIASVALMPDLDSTPIRLVLVTSVLAFPVGWHSGLRFAYVPAVLLAVPSGESPVSAAWEQGAAIWLGAVVGVLASLLVWPTSSKRRAQRALGLAIDDCRALTRLELGLLANENRKPRFDKLRRRFWKHLNAAQQSASHAMLRTHLDSGPQLTAVVGGIERLWYSLVLLDWLCAVRKTVRCDGSIDDIAPAVQQVRDIVAPVLDDVSRGLHDHRARLEAPRLTSRLARARDVVRNRAGVDGGPVPEIGPYAPVLAFALDELTAAIGDVSQLVGRHADQAQGLSDAPSST